MIDQESRNNLAIRRDFVGREVKANITDLADHLFGLDQVTPYADYEDFTNYDFTLCPECGESVANYPGLRQFTCPHCGYESEVDEIPEKTYAEPMEFYIVSELLGKQLEARGEMIMPRLLGWIWGRQTTGQAVYMDGVIGEICKHLGILEDAA